MRRTSAFTRFDGDLAHARMRWRLAARRTPTIAISATRLELGGNALRDTSRHLLHLKAVERAEELIQLSPHRQGATSCTRRSSASCRELRDRPASVGRGPTSNARLHEITARRATTSKRAASAASGCSARPARAHAQLDEYLDFDARLPHHDRRRHVGDRVRVRTARDASRGNGSALRRPQRLRIVGSIRPRRPASPTGGSRSSTTRPARRVLRRRLARPRPCRTARCCSCPSTRTRALVARRRPRPQPVLAGVLVRAAASRREPRELCRRRRGRRGARLGAAGDRLEASTPGSVPGPARAGRVLALSPSASTATPTASARSTRTARGCASAPRPSSPTTVALDRGRRARL